MIDTQAIRSKILGFALRGKLTEQMTDDGTAEELYAQIVREKARLIKEGKIKKTKPLESISDEEVPYTIPSNWKWVRLSEIAFLTSGGQYVETETGIPYVKVADMNLEENQVEIITSSRFVSPDNVGIIPVASIIFPKRGGAIATNKKRIVRKMPVFVDTNTMGMTMYYPPILQFIKIWFDSLNLEELQTGTSIPQINNKDLYPLVVPLPPASEQARIVEGIEAIFEILDKIDALQNQYASNQEALRSKLIDAAIQGKLTEQLPSDEKVEVTINELFKGRKELVNSGEIRKKKVLPEIEEAEYPFEIPQNWKWVHISDIWAIINGDRGKNYPAKSTLSHEGIPFISALNLDGTTVIEDDKLMCLSDEQYERLGSGKLRKGDVVVCIRGSLGKHGKYPFDKGAIASSLIIARNYIQNGAINDYLMIYLDSQLFKDEIEKYNGGSAQPNLAAESLEKFRIPFPPVDEQIRIVNRVKELLEKVTE